MSKKGMKNKPKEKSIYKWLGPPGSFNRLIALHWLENYSGIKTPKK